MFSIVIPLYNKENYIRSTIISILEQTIADFEIIIINDGSTDKSLKVVEQFKDNRIRIFSKKNEGVAIARNYAIAKSTFPFIVFLDADDYWEKDFLKTIKSLIDKYPQAGMYSTARKLIQKENIEVISYEKKNNEKEFLIDDYCKLSLTIGYNLCWTGSICLKREILEEVGGFPENIKRGEDLDLWIRVAGKYKIAYSSLPMAYYQKRNENTASSSFESYKESFPYWKWYEYNYNPRNSLHKYTTSVILNLTRSAYRSKKYDEAAYVLSQCKGRYFLFKRIFHKFKIIISQQKYNFKRLTHFEK